MMAHRKQALFRALGIAAYLCATAAAQTDTSAGMPADAARETPADTADLSNDSTQVSTTAPDTGAGPGKVIELDRMIVRDKRPRAKDQTAKPSVMTGDEIREAVRSTPLEELAQKSADVYVSSRGAGLHGVASGASGGIHVRGLGGSPNSQVLVVEDGVPDYQGIFGHPIPDAFVPVLMDRVVLVKGGDGVLYGTNAMGGVIVVENRWPSEEKTKLSTETAYGSFNTFRQRVCVEKSSDRIAAIAAGNAFITEGHRPGMDGNSGSAQLGLRTYLNPDWTFSVREKVVHFNGNDPGPVNDPNPDHWFDVLRNNAVLRLDGKLGPVFMTSSVWVNAGIHKLYDGFYSRDYTGGGKLEATGRIGEIVELIYGAQGDYVDGAVRNRTEDTREHVDPMKDGALYGQATVFPVKGLQAVLGGRGLYSDPYGFVPLYKCGVRWEFLDTVIMHARLTRNFRQPTLRELYLPFPTANPDLEPEYALNWDGGAEARFRKVFLGCTVFRTWATDLIKYFGAWPTAEVVNIDEIEIWGIDAAAGLRDIGPFAFEAAYCWQDVGTYTKQNPESKANANIFVRHPVGKWRGELKLGAEWVHGLYMDNYNRKAINDVFFVDMSARARRTTAKGIEIAPFVVVRNILDMENAYIENYTLPGIHVLCGLNLEL
ncbi:MAG: TonB-dependent receptor [Chitinivibrionales bacterium]|nr:TonB-dependent receptor [Chitinivibrionales bacterium]MBD3396661.1 TonB-dependent receptor [Chitinivibrionales bacterium]